MSEISPDLAVEVVSRGNTEAEMVRKREEYFAASARVVWIVDPSRGRGEIHRPGAQPVLIDQDGELAAEELLPGLRVRLGDVLRRAKRWTR